MLNVSPTIKGFIATFTPSADTDVVGYVVHASTISGFTPNSSNLVSNGPDTSVTCQVPYTGNVYVKVAAYDSFEDVSNINFSGLNYSTERVVLISPTNPLDTVAPTVPTGVSVVGGIDNGGQADTAYLTISWSAVVDTDLDLEGYSIQLKIGASTTYTEYTTGKGNTSYKITNLTPYTAYSARVAAFDKWGNISAWSAWVAVDINSITDSVPPNAPTSVVISGGFDTISVSASATKPSDWEAYEIQMATNSGFTAGLQTVVSASPLTVLRAAAGTYYVRALCVDRSGNKSGWVNSVPASVTTALSLPTALYNELRTDFLVNDALFKFGRAGDGAYPVDTSLYVVSSGGTLIWKNSTYNISTVTLTNAFNKYIAATCTGSTATLSVLPISTDLTAIASNVVIIAVTSSSKQPNSNGNYICYVRNSNSLELEGAIIRSATITTAQIKSLDIGDAAVTGTLNANRIGANTITADKIVVSGITIGGNQISTGALKADTEILVGSTTSGSIKLSGINNRIEVRKTGEAFDRVQIGKLSTGDYGLVLKNSAGDLLLTSDGSIDGTKVKNLYVNGNAVVGGSVTIGAATLTYSDGKSLEYYKPLEAGSTNGATLGTNIKDSAGSALTDADLKNNQDSIIRNPIGGYYTSTTPVVGGIKITLPQFFTNTMLKFYVDIYEYTAGFSCSLEIAGFNDGHYNWLETTARVVGDSNVEYPVTFGHNGAKSCIWIGNPTDTWSYPQVRIRDVFLGYSNYSAALWSTGWSINFDTATPTNVSSTIVDTLPGADWAKVSGSGKPADGADNTSTILGTVGTLTLNQALTVNSLLTIAGANAGLTSGLSSYNQASSSGFWMSKSSGSTRARIGTIDASNNLTAGLMWDGSVMKFAGQATFASGSAGYSNIADKPTSLSQISATDASTLADASTNAASAVASIADIASDNKFTSVEKSTTRQEWDIIVTEKSVLDAQATTFEITTEKAAYDTNFQSLANYLNNGTAWASGVPSWISDSNIVTTTTIVGATFRSTWKAYYDAKTALIVAIEAKAKALADSAQSTANTASSAATAAQTSAVTANSAIAAWTKPSTTLIDGNKIYTGAAYVDTLVIKGQAVTIPIQSFTAAYIRCVTNTWTTVQTASIVSTGAPITINIGAILSDTGNSEWGAHFRIYRNSTLLVQGDNLNHSDVLGFCYGDTPGYGTFKYELQIYPDSDNVDVSNRTMLLLETKK